MSMLTLFDSHGDLIATDQLVYAAEDIEPLRSLLDTASEMGKRLESLNREITRQEKQSRKRGFNDGLQRGRHFARLRMSRALLALEKEKHAQHEKQRQQSIDLALEIVRKIGIREPAADTLTALATQSAEELGIDEKASLCVHPEMLQEVSERLRNQPNTDWLLRVEADDSLDKLDCELKTGFGVLRIGLESQLRLIERSLRDAAE